MFSWGENEHGQLGENGEEREYTRDIHTVCALCSTLCGVLFLTQTSLSSSPSSPLPLLLPRLLPRLLPLLGHGTNLDLSIPTLISTILSGKPCAHIACGAQHSLCTTKQNDLYCFGRGAEGQVRNIRNIQIWIIKFSWNFQL